MSTSYTKASFMILCTPPQAALALLALDHLQQGYTEFMELALWKSENEPLCPEELIIRHCFYEHPEQTPENDNQDLPWEFEVMRDAEGLWVHHGETLDALQAAIFTQAVLKAFDLDDLVEIEAADVCSRPLVDAFGGHAHVVTRDYLRGYGLGAFRSAERDAHRNKSRYFVYRDNNTATYLASVSEAADFTPPPHFTEVGPLEFSIMKKYLPIAEMRSEAAGK